MKNQIQTYICLREDGAEYQLQPAGQAARGRGGLSGQNWYFITSRPLGEFAFMKIFGSYRDLQAAYSAMVLVDPSIEGPL